MASEEKIIRYRDFEIRVPGHAHGGAWVLGPDGDEPDEWFPSLEEAKRAIDESLGETPDQRRTENANG